MYRTTYGCIGKLNKLSAGLVFSLNLTVMAATPELRVLPDPQPAVVDGTFRVVYEIYWTGAPGEFAVLPPELPDIDWGEIHLASAQSGIRDGQNIVSYTVEIVPKEKGDFTTPDIAFTYISPEAMMQRDAEAGSVPSTVPDALPQLRADPLTLRVLPDRTRLWTAASLGASLFLAGACLLCVRRVMRKPASVGRDVRPSADFSKAKEALDSARRKLYDGDYYGFYRELASAAASVAPGDPAYAAKFSRLAEDVGYKNLRPVYDEMERHIREIERHVAQSLSHVPFS